VFTQKRIITQDCLTATGNFSTPVSDGISGRFPEQGWPFSEKGEVARYKKLLSKTPNTDH
jgi:hypothetical protein